MSGGSGRSSVSADAWIPVDDALLHSVVHAANNRVAALGGIVQLQDLELATPAEGIRAMREEFQRMRTLMERFRDLTLRRGDKKEALRFTDALRRAEPLLALHTATRSWKLTIADEPSDVGPVLLWPSDPLRFVCLLVIAATSGETPGEVYIGTLRNGTMTEVTVVAGSPLATVEARAEFIALREAVEREGGQLSATATNAGASVEITLALPSVD